MNKYLDDVANWLTLNKLSLNIDQTVYITFENYCDNVHRNIEIKINGKKLKRLESCKYLGIIFDYNVKWDKHIEYINKKTKYLIFIFCKSLNL